MFFSGVVFMLIIGTASADTGPAVQQCTCGFSVNSTSSESYALFTDLDEVDFLHTKNLTTQASSWAPQEYSVTAVGARGPYGKLAQVSNVIPNPLKSRYDWQGSGIHGGDPGLQIWARSAVVNGSIPMGELAIKRTDMWYGSYRVAMKVTGVAGTCGAFFWFRNDTQEIDVEFLSALTNDSSYPLNLVLQSPASVKAGYDASKTPNFDRYPLPFDPTDGFHEYRFDWLWDRVSFYADGQWLRDMTQDIPDSPGHLIINHWSNGDPLWSGGPPATDAVLTVSYIKSYFNSSDPKRQKAYRNSCGKNGALDKVCQIPDQVVAPDTGGLDGNATARTFFFTLDPLQAANNPSAYQPHSSGRRIKGNLIQLLVIWAMVGLSIAFVQSL